MFLVTFFLAVGPAQKLIAQCVENNDKRTALKFSNESRFELTFFVDDDEDGVIVPSRAVSNEITVEPGEHLLRARAIVRGESFWVWVVNEVPQGQVCTWTVTDPPRVAMIVTNRYRIAIDTNTKTKGIKGKRRQ